MYLCALPEFSALIRARGLVLPLATEYLCCVTAFLSGGPSLESVSNSVSLMFFDRRIDRVFGRRCLRGRDTVVGMMRRSSSLSMSLGMLCITSGISARTGTLGILTRSLGGFAEGEAATSHIE